MDVSEGPGAAVMMAEQLELLRTELPTFGSAPPSPRLQQYLEFYGLDFGARYPQTTYRFGTVSSGPFQLMAQCWSRPDATANLLLLHGYFDHTGLYDKLIDYGLSRGCNVLIFDLPGHGLSSGEPAVIDRFGDYADAVEAVLQHAELPELSLLAVGQSTGCAALIECARRQFWPFERVLFFAPLVRPVGWLAVRAGYQLLHRFTDGVTRKFNHNSSDAAFLAFVKHDPLQARRVSLRWVGALRRWLAALRLEDLGVGPVQVIQGCRDTTVDWRYNMKAVARLFPGADIHYLPDAGHQLANESADIREASYTLMDRFFFD